MRGKRLLDVLNDLRVEIGASLAPNHNVNVRESHVIALRKTQEWLWDDFAWPHLRVERQLPIQAGMRYYPPPIDIPIERIEKLEFFTDGDWFELGPTIEGYHYARWNSDLDERSWPPQRWRLAEDAEGDEGQLELWPIADRNGDDVTRDGYLKIIGIRSLRPFVDATDTLDLDDQLVILYTAAKLITDKKQAQLVLSQAQKRDARLRAALSKPARFVMFGTRRVIPAYGGRPIAVYRAPGT